MSFPFATISSMHHYPSGPTRLLLVDGEEVQYAARTALLAITRMTDAQLEALVEERVADAQRHNSRWFAFGPLRAETNREVLKQQIMNARPDEDDSLFMATMRLRLMRMMATDALAAPRRGDGKVALAEHIWDVIGVYRRSKGEPGAVHPLSSN